MENLVPCCKSCNSRKNVSTVESLRIRLQREDSIYFDPEQIEYLRLSGFDVPDNIRYVFYFEKIEQAKT